MERRARAQLKIFRCPLSARRLGGPCANFLFPRPWFMGESGLHVGKNSTGGGEDSHKKGGKKKGVQFSGASLSPSPGCAVNLPTLMQSKASRGEGREPA